MKYNAFHDTRSAWQVISEAPLLVKRFFTHNDYHDVRTTITVICCLAVGIAYVMLPIDILDEDVYGVSGMIDDFGVVGGILIYVSLIIFKAVVHQAIGA